MTSSGCPSAVVKTGSSCDDGNPCILSETCQSSGSCGGGSKASITTSCGNNKYCDGNGSCKCRTQSSWNLLNNPGFDGSASSWSLNGGATYITADVDSCSGSGSVALQALAANVTQCVSAKPSTTYYFGYRFKALGGSSSAGTATGFISFLPAGSNCDSSLSTNSGSANQSYNTNNWIQASGSVTSDSDTAQIVFHMTAPASNGSYDQVYLSTSSPGVPAF